MTVKELKEKLNELDDNLIVMVPDVSWTPGKNQFPCTPATSVAIGINESDSYLFISD